MRRGCVLASLSFLALVCAPATAQTPSPGQVPSLDLRRFAPPTDPEASIALEPSTTPGAGNWNIGAWASYALDPVQLRDANDDTLAQVVEHQVSMDYYAGVGIGKRLALGVLLPTVVYQTGDNVTGLLPGSTRLPATALGDAVLGAKVTLVSPSDLGGFGLAAIGRFFVPTGNNRSYLSDESVRGEMRLLGELDLLAVSLLATAGGRLRAAKQKLIDDGTDDFLFGHDLPWALGVNVRPQAFGIDPKGRWRWTLESRGAVAITPRFASGPQSPALIALSARYTVDDVSAFFGVEAPLDDAVGNPRVRPVLGIGWAPRFEDADGDQVEDRDDLCPELAEDRDGFEDDDGCPDFDDDFDGVADENDRCPREAEDEDGFDDGDGCPDPDNDADGVPDEKDACPDQAGRADWKEPGCPVGDTDGDGVLDDRDRCIEKAEDADGYQDDDGCPDPDNDSDGVPDAEDACPDEPGQARPDPELSGCPSPDSDGDTYDDEPDECPDAPEDFDGVDDTDGCPDEEGGRPLVTIEERADGPVALLPKPLRFGQDDTLDEDSMMILRALAQKLNEHPDWIVAVGVRPVADTPEGHQRALNRSFSIVLALRELTYRDSAAETLGWPAVKDQPGARNSGVGILVLAPPRAEASDAP